MTNQLNTLVTTQWLLPLFNEQLEHLHQRWSQSLKTQDFVEFAKTYHNFAGSLNVANLTVFGQLAKTIEVFLQAISTEQVDTAHSHTLLFASELLIHELNNYVKTGQYQSQLLQKRSHYLQQILQGLGVNIATIQVDDSFSKRNINTLLEDDADGHIMGNEQAHDGDGNLIDYIQAPTPKSARKLNEKQFTDLSLVWRHSIQHLLLLNENDTEKLQKLNKASHYLLIDAVAYQLPLNQGLWYLTGLWLTSLTQSKTPKPAIYSHVLADLDHAIMLMKSERNQPILVKALLADVYIQLNGLHSELKEARAVLERIHNGIHNSKAFLPRLLERLEKLIFKLDEPQTIIKPLQDMKSQLARRGWYLYEQQVEQILCDLYEVQNSPGIYDDIRWQIERQLQELYGAMFNSSQTIDAEIGQGQLIYQETETTAPITHSDSNTGINMAAIRKVRIAVEDIKTAFNTYLKQHSLESLPQSSEFETLRHAFLGMGLHDVVEVTEQCRQIFAEIREYELTQLTRKLTDIIAQGLATFELFLDYMAQQTLDLELLSKSMEKFELAQAELLVLSQFPEMADQSDADNTSDKSDSEVLRYDDSGEIIGQSATDVITSEDASTSEDVIDNNDETVDNDEPDNNDETDNNIDINTDTDIAALLSNEDNDAISASLDDDDEFEILLDDDTFTHPLESSSKGDVNHLENDDTVEPSSADIQEIQSPATQPPSSKSPSSESPEMIAAKEALKEDNFDMDEEIKEIFLEEADEVLEELEEHLPVWQADPMDLTPLAEIRRGFHTLKGSGRMVGAFNAGELAWAVENLLNRVLDKTLPVTDELIQFIRDTKALIPVLVADFAAQKPPSINPAFTVLKANNLIKGKPIDQGMPDELGTPQALTNDSIADEITGDSISSDAITMPIDESVDSEASVIKETTIKEDSQQSNIDIKDKSDVVEEPTIQEDAEHSDSTEGDIDFDDDFLFDDVIQEVDADIKAVTAQHTGAVSSDKAKDSKPIKSDDESGDEGDIDFDDDFLFDDDDSADAKLNEVRSDEVKSDEAVDIDQQQSEQQSQLASHAVTISNAGEDTDTLDDTNQVDIEPTEADQTAQSDTSKNLPEALLPFIQEVDLPADDDEADEDIKEIFIEEAGEVLEEITPIFKEWRGDVENTALLGEVRRGFHTLKGSGRMVGAFYSGELAWAIENMLNRVLDNTIDPNLGIPELIDDVLQAYPDIVTTFENANTDYPELMTFWAATANAYSKNKGSEFDYNDAKVSYEASISKADMTKLDASAIETSEADSTSEQTLKVQALKPDTAKADISDSDGDKSLREAQELDASLEHAKTQPSTTDQLKTDEAEKDELETDESELDEPQVDTVVTEQRDRAATQHDASDIPPIPIEVHPDNVLDSLQLANDRMAEADLPTPSLSEDDQEFYSIFLEEVVELVDNVKKFLDENVGKNEVAVNDDVVRAFHTLRGAAGSESLKAVSEVSATVEHSLKLLQQHEEPMNASHLEAVKQSVALIERYIEEFKSSDIDNNKVDTQTDDGTTASDTNKGIDETDVSTKLTDSVQSVNDMVKADSHKKQESQHSVEALQEMFDSSIVRQKFANIEYNIADIISDDIEDLLDAEWALKDQLTKPDDTELSLYAEVIAAQIERLVNRVSTSSKFISILSSLHSVYKKIETDPNVARQPNVIDTLQQGHKQLIGLFDSIAGSMSLHLDDTVVDSLNAIAPPTPVKVLLGEQVTDELEDTESANINRHGIETLDIEDIHTDAELLEIFSEEAQEIDASVHTVFDQWKQAPENLDTLKVLQRHLHTVKGGARMAGITSIGDLTHEAETIYEMFVNERLTPTNEWVEVMQSVQDVLSQQIDYVVNNQQSFYANELVEQLKLFSAKGELPEHVNLTLPLVINDTKEDASALDAEGDSDADEATESTSLAHLQYTKLLKSSWNDEQPDTDILGVFLEEAEDIIESSAEYLKTFRSHTSDLSVLQNLQRNLHTIKGGARMVQANGIADLSHHMETVYEDLSSRRRPATKMIGQLLEASHDWLASAIFILQHQINPPTPTQLIESLKAFSKDPDSLHEIPVESLQFYKNAIEEYEAYQKSQNKQRNIDKAPPMAGNFEKAQEQTTFTSEMIRISAGLMERMINLSGESAINRARIDMEITSLTNTIEEMGVTVQRLADQLRRMDIELEEQVLAQIDDEDLLGKADFDPLEMDQYSSLNQLSKSLSESASDLLDIKTTMLDKTRDAEGLLLQLSRTQAELQDGLMDSRMVPFSRLTPRLQRIVRQTANELNKLVELKIINADDEMDRTILERITSPLEHMLRNAVDHGIETSEEREAVGKPRVGRIVLEVLREGSEVVIHLSDDGNGINVEAVRQKAISQGLIDPNDTSLTDLDVMQYIFNAGLTTTNKVTQISGRGVGMDVVLSEIRQLGGVVSVESKEGGGSRFSIRVPLTVAISDALVVRVGEHYYAVPLVQIERVVRVNPERLYRFYQSDKPTFEIDGMEYRLRYLNEILKGTDLNELSVNTNVSLPVIIVKNQTGQQLAIQVDEVAGSRIEVVVKPLGRQLSHASGISAATIMADGSVMLILDLMALLRNAPARTQMAAIDDREREEEQATQSRPSILIIDDSVTVRKVTSRLLERQGYETHVAKDGIDAIEVLQDLTPDLMLLDIEMPRMDGFEVATQVRHDSRLKNIPIIMITSRTGDKHRERALEIGVNDYMGKPYQEAQLLNTVQGLLGQNVHE